MIRHFSVRREIPANVKHRDQTQADIALVQFLRSLSTELDLQHFKRIDKSLDESTFYKQLASIAEAECDANRGWKQSFFWYIRFRSDFCALNFELVRDFLQESSFVVDKSLFCCA